MLTKLVVFEIESKKYSKDDSSVRDSHFQFTSLLYVIASILHWFEYGLLAYGFMKFLRKTSTWDQQFRLKKIKEHVKEYKWQSLMLTIVLLLFLFISLAIPTAEIIQAHKK